MNEVVVVEAVRTPIGREDGLLSQVEPIALGALVLEEVVRRADIEPSQVDDVIMGCVTQTDEQGLNVARLAALHAGFPVEVTAVSINRQCGSSQQAIHFAAQAILAGDMDIVIAAGMESMSRVPMGSDYPDHFPYGLVPQGISAEMVAEQWGLTRRALDQFSFDSHVKAGRAAREGRFDREILPIEVRTNGRTESMITDEGIRFEPDMAKMASLPTAFKDEGLVTAGNSSQISDGAAAVLLMSRERASEIGVRPRARVVTRVVAGTDPCLG